MRSFYTENSRLELLFPTKKNKLVYLAFTYFIQHVECTALSSFFVVFSTWQNAKGKLLKNAKFKIRRLRH